MLIMTLFWKLVQKSNSLHILRSSGSNPMNTRTVGISRSMILSYLLCAVVRLRTCAKPLYFVSEGLPQLQQSYDYNV